MSWNMMFHAIKQELPKFNDYLLKGYREEQIKHCADYMDSVYREAVKLFNGDLVYKGYRVLSPEERIAYNLTTSVSKNRLEVQQSELQLVQYQFQFTETIQKDDGTFVKEERMIPVHIYLPYLYNGSIVIRDTRYFMQLPIIERMIYRITDGVIIKVMRSPLQFWRTTKYAYQSTSGLSFYDSLITTKVHYKRGTSNTAKNQQTPLLLYLLSRYNFLHLVTNIFGLSSEMIRFTTEDDPHDPNYLYFACGENIYLRVDKDNVMPDITFRRFVASLLYIVKSAKRFNIEDLYNQTFYKTILGKSLYGASTKDSLAANHAESDLRSLQSYLDIHTKQNLELLHIYCNDIFDLFVTVFFNIDSWLLDYSPNDLFAKRLGGIELLLMGSVKNTFTRFYETLRKNKTITTSNIQTMLKMDSMAIAKIHMVPCISSNTSLYNDNTLISTLIKKIRLISTQENRRSKKTNLISAKEHIFHPSFLAIESVLAISSSSPGISGDINPFAVIDNNGSFLKDQMPWIDEILPLSRYLVSV